MFRRNEKVKILSILLFWLLALPQWAVAAWLCPKTLQTFPTADECSLFCPGADCIESGTYMCSADTDGDGEIELYQCQQVERCPLGDYPCTNGICIDPNQTYYVKQTSSISCQFMFDTRSGQTIYFSSSGNCISITVGLKTWKGCFEGVTFSGSLSFRGNSRCPSCVHYYSNKFCYNTSCISISGGIFETNILSALIWAHPVYIQADSKGIYINQWGCGTSTYLKVKKQVSANCTSEWKCPVNGGTACEDISISENYEDESPDLSYYQDDGQVDPDTGECLGQIYIFNGRPMMCRRSGAQTGFHNCCDADDEVVRELNDQLAAVGGTFAVVSQLKDAVSLAYKAIELYNTASNYAQALGATLDKAFLRDAALNLNTPTTVYNAVLDAVQAGGGAADGALNAIVNGLGLTPTGIITQIALSFAMDFAMKILFSGCSEDDVMTAAYNELGLCHYVGTKCVTKLPVIGCVQKANIYCCFNSKLARIIHEQGRPQLKNFGGWGTTDYPNCRGFTPQEFQMLDFSKIDLSEWYGDIEVRTQQEIQQNLQQNLNNFRQNIR